MVVINSRISLDMEYDNVEISKDLVTIRFTAIKGNNPIYGDAVIVILFSSCNKYTRLSCLEGMPSTMEEPKLILKKILLSRLKTLLYLGLALIS